MSPSRVVWAVFAIGVTGAAISASAAEPSPGRQVIKNDGSVSWYRLLPVHHDPGHAAVVAKRLANAKWDSTPLPASYQISTANLPPIRDQGQRGTCAYFATVGIIETYYQAQSSSKTAPTLSEECLVDVRNWMVDQGTSYAGDDAPDQRPDPNGDLPFSIVKTVTEDGVPLAQKFSSTVDCTYNGDNTNGGDVALTDYLAAVGKSGAAFAKGAKFDQNSAPTVDAIKALIASNVPVEVGIIVYNEYMNETDWRFDASQDTEDNIAGGHAIQLTGYTTQNGKTIFTFKNSWGATWGNSGFGTIDDAILTNSWGFESGLDFTVALHG